jgi:hypothetical protein
MFKWMSRLVSGTRIFRRQRGLPLKQCSIDRNLHSPVSSSSGTRLIEGCSISRNTRPLIVPHQRGSAAIASLEEEVLSALQDQMFRTERPASGCPVPGSMSRAI